MAVLDVVGVWVGVIVVVGVGCCVPVVVTLGVDDLLGVAVMVLVDEAVGVGVVLAVRVGVPGAEVADGDTVDVLVTLADAVGGVVGVDVGCGGEVTVVDELGVEVTVAVRVAVLCGDRVTVDVVVPVIVAVREAVVVAVAVALTARVGVAVGMSTAMVPAVLHDTSGRSSPMLLDASQIGSNSSRPGAVVGRMAKRHEKTMPSSNGVIPAMGKWASLQRRGAPQSSSLVHGPLRSVQVSDGNESAPAPAGSSLQSVEGVISKRSRSKRNPTSRAPTSAPFLRRLT